MPSVKYTSPRREVKAPSAWSSRHVFEHRPEVRGAAAHQLEVLHIRLQFLQVVDARVSDRTWSSHWRMRMFTFRVKVSVLRKMA